MPAILRPEVLLRAVWPEELGMELVEGGHATDMPGEERGIGMKLKFESDGDTITVQTLRGRVGVVVGNADAAGCIEMTPAEARSAAAMLVQVADAAEKEEG